MSKLTGKPPLKVKEVEKFVGGGVGHQEPLTSQIEAEKAMHVMLPLSLFNELTTHCSLTHVPKKYIVQQALRQFLDNA